MVTVVSDRGCLVTSTDFVRITDIGMHRICAHISLFKIPTFGYNVSYFQFGKPVVVSSVKANGYMTS